MIKYLFTLILIVFGLCKLFLLKYLDNNGFDNVQAQSIMIKSICFLFIFKLKFSDLKMLPLIMIPSILDTMSGMILYNSIKHLELIDFQLLKVSLVPIIFIVKCKLINKINFIGILFITIGIVFILMIEPSIYKFSIVLVQLSFAIQMVIEEYLLKNNYTSIYLLIFGEGIFGIIYNIILYIFTDLKFDFKIDVLENNQILILIILAIIFITACDEFINMYLINNMGAYFKSFVDVFRIIILLILKIIMNKNNSKNPFEI